MDPGKRFFRIAAALLFAAVLGGCVREERPEPSGVTLRVSREGTRSELQEDGAVWWSPGDRMLVFAQPGKGSVFVSENREPAPVADFSGIVEDWQEDLPLYGFYPASDQVSFDGERFTVTLPSVQEAVPGSFAPGLSFSAGRGSLSGLSMGNVLSGICFSVHRSDVRSVTLKTLDGEAVAGSFSFTLGADGRPADISPAEASDQLVLRSPDGTCLQPGVPYYLMLLPGAVSGYTLTLTTDDAVGTHTSAAPVTFSRSVFKRIGPLAGISWKPIGSTLPIPDPDFKAVLLAWDTDGDHELSPEEAAAITSLTVNTDEVASLEGLRFLPNLTYLSCCGTRAADADRTIQGRLTELDLSGNPLLKELLCTRNHLETLDLSGNPLLERLSCYGNSLKALSFREHPQLKHLDCGDALLSTLDLSGAPALQSLYCHNNRLTGLDLSANSALTALTCDRNQLKVIDLTAQESLSSLRATPMNDTAGANLLREVIVTKEQRIPGVTENRSASSLPAATIVFIQGAPSPATGLPIVYVWTAGGAGIDSKDVWLENCAMKMVDAGGETLYETEALNIRGRGNSTWGYPKRPYALKLPKKANLAGSGKFKRWVLLANWMDRTLLRNEVAFEAARRTSLDWTPAGRFVELYLNGAHQGNYWLGDQVKMESGRVPGDVLLEMDTYYDADYRFWSNWGYKPNTGDYGLPIGVKYPDEEDMTDALFADIKNRVSRVEKSLYVGSEDFHNLLDLNSFADWYLVHELSWNVEPNHPKSCYFHFQGEKMIAGPVWDFDWYTFVPGEQGLGLPRSIYFGVLLQDAAFVALLKERWSLLKPAFSSLTSYIDEKAEEIRASEALNAVLWPYTYDVNGDCSLSFSQAVARMKSALRERIDEVDKALQTL